MRRYLARTRETLRGAGWAPRVPTRARVVALAQPSHARPPRSAVVSIGSETQPAWGRAGRRSHGAPRDAHRA
jgi:hypothetical protein